MYLKARINLLHDDHAAHSIREATDSLLHMFLPYLPHLITASSLSQHYVETISGIQRLRAKQNCLLHGSNRDLRPCTKLTATPCRRFVPVDKYFYC